MKILGIIPARGGSKGIINKNIVEVNGCPLIDYTIQPALSCVKQGILNELVVSTDSEKIAEIAKELGANCPFLRPEELSNDKSKSIDFVLHTIEYFEHKKTMFDAVIILQPTSPLRKYEHIKEAIEVFKNYPNKNSLISCYKDEVLNELIMYHKKGDEAIPLKSNHHLGIRRQDHKTLYIRNGAIYISKVNYLKKNKSIMSKKPLMYEMPKSLSLNIDHPDGLDILKRSL